MTDLHQPVVFLADPAQGRLVTAAVLLGLLLWVGTVLAGIRFARWLFRARRARRR